MMTFRKYLIPLLTLVAIATFVYLFTNVFVYLVISMVLALVGAPFAQFLSEIKIGKFRISGAIASLLTLVLFFVLIYLIGITFLPPLVSQMTFLSTLNFHDVTYNILQQYPDLKYTLSKFGTEEQIMSTANDQINQLINFKNLSSILNNTISYAGSFLGGVFSVLFITFFFLKDEKMVVKSLLLITPSSYEGEMIDIFRTSKKMLSKYFIGLLIDVVLISFIVTILMWLFGIKNALVIGCLAGVMNVIPYIGPMITLIFAVFLGVSGCIEFNQYELISSTITKIVFILIGTNLVDAFFIQPTIFSNTVKAHPLEIFIVILMAGALGGILGMVVAIPSYTLLRIIAKEFLNHMKFFKKLTENIPE
jgi:predicted PurR-regulated permease PerM